MKQIFRVRLAQEAPAAPAPEAPMPDAGAMDLGDLGGAPMADLGGAPPAPIDGGTGPASGSDKIIRIPLSNVGLILQDAKIKQNLAENIGVPGIELANRIWEQYGGNIIGDDFPNKTGERTDKNEATDEEIEVTQHQRWKRLPLGKTITDITSLDTLKDAVVFTDIGYTKEIANKAKGGGGGGMPGMASRKLDYLIRLGYNLDSDGEYSKADLIDKILG
jgi:hypothetical protein